MLKLYYLKLIPLGFIKNGFQQGREFRTVPASKPVQNTPLFHTQKNTGHTNEIQLYRPVNGYRAETRQAFFFLLLLILTFFKGKMVIFLNRYSNPNTTHTALFLSIPLKLSLSCSMSLISRLLYLSVSSCSVSSFSFCLSLLGKILP